MGSEAIRSGMGRKSVESRARCNRKHKILVKNIVSGETTEPEWSITLKESEEYHQEDWRINGKPLAQMQFRAFGFKT